MCYSTKETLFTNSQFSMYCVTWCSTTVPIRSRNIILKHCIWLGQPYWHPEASAIWRIWKCSERFKKSLTTIRVLKFPSQLLISTQILNLTECSVSTYPYLRCTFFFSQMSPETKIISLFNSVRFSSVGYEAAFSTRKSRRQTLESIIPNTNFCKRCI